MKVIDLFAGCGGMSSGFVKAGYAIHAAVEYDPIIASTYVQNHPHVRMIVDDIKNVDHQNVFKENDADVIIGGPPCQGFSMAGARIRNGFIDDPRNYLFKHYFNIVRTVKPKAFVMENVKGMLTMHGGEIFAEIKKLFSDSELLDGEPYYLYCKVINALDYGVPQKRERLIIIGTKLSTVDFEQKWRETKAEIENDFPGFFDAVNILDAIGNLPATHASGIVRNPIPQNAYQRYLATNNELLHNHNPSRHSAAAVERMRNVANGENYTVLNENINSVHSGSYGRMCWEDPAVTITTRFDTPAGGRFIHPVENRTITPREAARIQSFSDDFVFYGDKRSISRQIGNAVPPKVSYFLARLVQSIIKEDE